MQRILIRHVVGIDPRAAGGADAPGPELILDRDRHARQRTDRLATIDPPIDGPGLVERHLSRHREERVEASIECIDPLDEMAGDFGRRQAPRHDSLADLPGGHPVKIGRQLGHCIGL
jgi:hypothetical protein